MSVNWESNASSAGEMVGPRGLSFACEALLLADGRFEVEVFGSGVGGSVVSEKKESSSPDNGSSLCGFGVFAVTGDFGLLAWPGLRDVEDGTTGAGVSLNVSQSSSSSSRLLSAAIPGAMKSCSQ